MLFRVYRPDAVAPEILDNYREMVRSLSFLHDDAWFVVYNADVRMRSEQFERLCWRAEREHAAPSGPRRQHVELRPHWAVEDTVRDGRRGQNSGGMRTCTGPPSSTSLASSRLPWKMVPQSLLWSAALELPQGKGPGIAHAACVSIHGIPRSPLHQSVPAKEKKSATISIPVRVLAPRHLFLLQLERRSGTGRRDRKSRIGGSDISLPLAPWKRLVVELQ